MSLTTPKIVLESLLQTLPLNIELNNSFKKYPLKEDDSFKVILERIVPQFKLINHEMEETLDAKENLEENMDGIGDIITTADGLIGFLKDTKYTDYNDHEVGLINTETDINLETAQEFSSQAGINLTVEDLLKNAYILGLCTYNESLASLEMYSSERDFENVIALAEKFDGEVSGSIVVEKLLNIAYLYRYVADSYSRYLGFCPVKILKEVHASNMSKLCPSYEEAVVTLADYNKKGLEAIKIAESGIEGKYQIVVTEDTEFKGQVIPAGKFMKWIGYTKPNFSDKTFFELNS